MKTDIEGELDELSDKECLKRIDECCENNPRFSKGVCNVCNQVSAVFHGDHEFNPNKYVCVMCQANKLKNPQKRIFDF